MRPENFSDFRMPLPAKEYTISPKTATPAAKTVPAGHSAKKIHPECLFIR